MITAAKPGSADRSELISTHHLLRACLKKNPKIGPGAMAPANANERMKKRSKGLSIAVT